MDVKDLIAHLSAHGVEAFEGYGIKVSFKFKSDVSPGQVTIPFGIPSTKAEETAPHVAMTSAPLTDPGLAQAAEAELSYDKILNWSASPDPNETPTPMTGDSAPLTQG